MALSTRVVTTGAALLLGAVGVIVPAASARAAAGPTIGNPSVTRVNHGISFRAYGTATAGSTVVLHYHKAGTPPSDYSIERSVTAGSDGVWYRDAILDTDYRLFATVGIGNPHSATVLFTSAGATPPSITSPASTSKPYGQLVTVLGRAAPGAPVVIHYRRVSNPSVDIPRSVSADDAGYWGRNFILDSDYTVFATVGTGNPHTATVSYTGHDATVGDVLDIDYAPTSGPPDAVQTTVGAQLSAYDNNIGTTSAGTRRVRVDICVRNRGPRVFSDDPQYRSFALINSSVRDDYYEPIVSGTVRPPDLQNMQPGDLRCGGLVFDVPIAEDIDTFGYAPGQEDNYYAGYWQVSGSASSAASRATPGAASGTSPNAAPAHRSDRVQPGRPSRAVPAPVG